MTMHKHDNSKTKEKYENKYTSPCALTLLHQIDTRLMGRTKDTPGTTIRLSTVNQGRMTCTTRVTIRHRHDTGPMIPIHRSRPHNYT
jgi:hypothetical protein